MLRAARAVPRLPDHRQQHRRAQRRGVHRAGDRRRPLPLERGVPHPVASASRRRAPTSTPASRSIRSTRRSFGQDTPIPSMQLCIENVDQSGGCSYGYSCAYTDSISWASPDAAAADDPRPARRCSISCSASAPRPASARERRAEDRSILDWLTAIGRAAEERARRRRSRAARTTTSTTSARSSGASRRSRRTTAAASRASCPARRSACPIRSPSTSS